MKWRIHPFWQAIFGLMLAIPFLMLTFGASLRSLEAYCAAVPLTIFIMWAFGWFRFRSRPRA